MINADKQSNQKLLVELRPALDGYAGIPQETRLLFSMLLKNEDYSVHGVIQKSHIVLSGVESSDENNAIDSSASLIGIIEREGAKQSLIPKVKSAVKKRIRLVKLFFSVMLGKNVKLKHFQASAFPDFVWRYLFAKSLAVSERNLVCQSTLRIIEEPWSLLHQLGLQAKKIFKIKCIPSLDASNYDFFISQTPYPAKVIGAKLLVRYHDTFPVTMPHTVANRAKHRQYHLHALRQNVDDGAYFICVSEATKNDLISLFPEVSGRAFTVYNSIGPSYKLGEGGYIQALQIINSAVNTFEKNPLIQDGELFLLMVSTIEPRKNHELLIQAFEKLIQLSTTKVKLVLVGACGWESERINDKLNFLVRSGVAICIKEVSSEDLSVLYRSALLTVCPSLAEGFDFSGVESMSSGGLVAASDIPVHREIYKDAAYYFDPYDYKSCLEIIKLIVNEMNTSSASRESMVKKSLYVSSRYTQEVIASEWQGVFECLSANEKVKK